MEQTLTIKIVNWEKYNPKAFESRNPHWFRLHSKLYSSPIIHALTPPQRWVWVALLCLSCERRSAVLIGSLSWFAWAIQVDENTLLGTIEKLSEYGAIEPCIKKTDQTTVQRPSQICAATEHNKTEQNTTKQEKRDKVQIRKSAYADPLLPDLMQIWNSNCGALTQASRMTRERKTVCKIRWNEMPDESYWIAVAKRLAASSFCNGENDRGWKANFDFFLRAKTAVKALEGQYDPTPGGRKQTHADAVSSANQALYNELTCLEGGK